MGLIMGLLLGSLFSFALPTVIAKYLSIAVLASLDSLLGGWRAVLEDNFDGAILLTGFFTNALLAAALAYMGDLLGLDLYLAAVIAFGIRIFNNLGFIRRGLVQQIRLRRLRRFTLRQQQEEALKYDPMKQYQQLSRED